MLFVVSSLIHLIVPVICDRPSQTFDQSLQLGSRVAAVDLKKRKAAARHKANETIHSLADLGLPKGNEITIQFAPTENELGFDVKQDNGAWYVESVEEDSAASKASLEPNMQIIRINNKPVGDMSQVEVRHACAHVEPKVLDLVVMKSGGLSTQHEISNDFDDEIPPVGMHGHPAHGDFHELQETLAEYVSEERFEALSSECQWTDEIIGKALSNEQAFKCLRTMQPPLQAGRPLSKAEYRCMHKDLIRIQVGDPYQWIRNFFKSSQTSGGVGEVTGTVSQPAINENSEPEPDPISEILSQCCWSPEVSEKFRKVTGLSPPQDRETGAHLLAHDYDKIRRWLERSMPAENVPQAILKFFKKDGATCLPMNGGLPLKPSFPHDALFESGWKPTGQCLQDWHKLNKETGGEKVTRESCADGVVCEFTQNGAETKICVPRSCDTGAVQESLSKREDASHVTCGKSEQSLPNVPAVPNNTRLSPVSVGNPKAVSSFATQGVKANKQLRNELCRALHNHKHLRLSSRKECTSPSKGCGPPLYLEAETSPQADSEEAWELFMLCPFVKKPEQVAALPEAIRSKYKMKPTNVIVQAVQDKSHRATWIPDRAEMIFNKETHTLTLDLGAPLKPEDAYPRIGENISGREESLALPDILAHDADCRLIVQLYFVPAWDRDEAKEGDLVIGRPRTDVIPTLQCCHQSNTCTENERTWWKSFV
jgi:hypothetical protein